jgi:CheY-like chemotaxis protein
VREKLPSPSRASEAAAGNVANDTAPGSESSRHVLIADGDETSRALREEQLRTAGFRVSVARTAFEAIVKASCHVPDVILLDDSLSDIEPTETGRLLTTCPVTAHIPVLRLLQGRRRLLPQRMLLRLRRAIA